MINIFSSKNAAALNRALGPAKKCTWAEILPIPAGYKFKAGDQLYLDISDLSPAELKKALVSLKKSGAFWGIIDPKGCAEDPASFFFDGASDYIGPVLVKKGLDKKRFAAALSCFAVRGAGKKAEKEAGAATQKKTVKLPAGKFGGWKTIRAGSTESFFFLFVSLSEQSNIRSHVGEAGYGALKNRLRDVLLQGLREANALLWMETEEACLFLVPRRAENCKMAIEASLKLILNSRLIGIEKLSLSFLADFTFALHYGQTIFQAPGKTGTVISQSVNYIFHLGAKKAEPGRLTISGDVPEEAIPEELSGLFSPAGVFEGIPIRHSRRFVYK